MASNSLYKFIGAFLGIILVVGSGWWAWDNYFSPQARNEPKFDQEKYDAFIKNAEDVLRADTYGGKTPQETLDLFIAALRAGDVDLASKYFALNTNSQSPDYLKQDPKWVAGLIQAKEERQLEKIINLLEVAEPALEDITRDDDYAFRILNNSGESEGYVDMKLNTYSNVWKIESL